MKSKYKKPGIIAESKNTMAECRPSNKPQGRPCNMFSPGGVK